jgi:hypothetical protein
MCGFGVMLRESAKLAGAETVHGIEEVKGSPVYQLNTLIRFAFVSDLSWSRRTE